MGIHNLAIVFPQFIVSVDRLRSRSRQIALVASVIFKLADGDDAVQPTGDPPQAGRTGVATYQSANLPISHRPLLHPPCPA
jgi:hypothetical protein